MTVLLLSALPVQSRPPTYYQYLTNTEAVGHEGYWSRWNFFFYDTLLGPVRSNDMIGIKYRASFLDEVSSSAPRFYSVSPPYLEVYTAIPPVFNRPRFQFPSDLPHLRERATRRYDSDDERLMTKIVFNDEEGASVFQRRLGIFAEDSLIDILQFGEDQIVWVDGRLEVKGVVNGRYTLFARGPIELLDNLVYPDSDPETGDFDERSTSSMIGLVSLSDILISNTIENGKDNGYHEDVRNNDRHSIMINGCLLALNGSFTFEENPLDRYNREDFRGRVGLVGSVVQSVRGGFWTGYNQNYFGGHQQIYGQIHPRRYDNRLRLDGPPGLGPNDYPIIQQDNGTLDLVYGEYEVYTSNIRSSYLRNGGRLVLKPDSRIEITDSIVFRSPDAQPVEIVVGEGRATISLVGATGYAEFENVIFGDGIDVESNGRFNRIVNCEFSGEVSLSGDLYSDSSRFRSSLIAYSAPEVEINRCIMEDGVTISSNSNNVLLSNCTIVKSNGVGLRLRGNCEARIVNSIIAFNHEGIVVEGSARLGITYCDIFGNTNVRRLGVDLGIGCITEDPMLIEIEIGDFRLSDSSPCIDAGDPQSTPDPDGSRAEIGAIPLGHRLFNADFSASVLPSKLSLSSFPNPFNSSTTISYSLPRPGRYALSVIDITGREVARLSEGWREAGSYRNIWNASGLPSGAYQLLLHNDLESHAAPLLLVK